MENEINFYILNIDPISLVQVRKDFINKKRKIFPDCILLNKEKRNFKINLDSKYLNYLIESLNNYSVGYLFLMN